MEEEIKTEEPVEEVTTENLTNVNDSATIVNEDDKIAFLVPIAQEILKIIGENNAYIGELSSTDREPLYKEINAKILDLLVEKDICFTDRNLIFDLVMEAYETVRSVIDNSLRLSYETACGKAFGVTSMEDIKLSTIDSVLKS
jgi:hypothetical protein